MISKVSIENFRSIETAKLALAPITVLYGPTASGKSSVLYAILALKNFVLNPNRQADGLLHLGFMDLGGFEACVFEHDPKRSISLSVTYGNNKRQSSYGLSFSKTSGDISLVVGSTATLQGKVNIPYALNQTFPTPYQDGEEEFTINWNGIACAVVAARPTAQTNQQAAKLAADLNAPSERLKGVDIAPHKRGFFKPSYTPVSVSPSPASEDEAAAIIINDPHMAGRISTYVEDIFGKDFRLYQPPGTATVFFQTTDKQANQGFV